MEDQHLPEIQQLNFAETAMNTLWKLKCDLYLQPPPLHVFMHFSCKFIMFSSSLQLSTFQAEKSRLRASGQSILTQYQMQVKKKKKLHCRTEQMYKSMYTHIPRTVSHSVSLTPTHPHSKNVNTKQLKILPAHMSRILWVQLLSPKAVSAFLCQRNSSPKAPSHTITLLTSGLMAGLLTRARFPIITLWSPPSLWYESLHESFDYSLMQLKWGQFSCLWCVTVLWTSPMDGLSSILNPVGWCCSVSVASYTFPSYAVLSSRSPVPGYVRARFVLLLGGGRVLSAQSELWNHPQAGVPRPSDSWQLHEEIRQGDPQLPELLSHDNAKYFLWQFFTFHCLCFCLLDYRQCPAVLRWHHSKGLSKSCQERESGRYYFKVECSIQ